MAAAELKVYEEKMNKTMGSLNEEFNTIRVGRANPHILDKITVDYYGTPTPIGGVGTISVPEARMMLIQPWDSSMLKAIEKAILISDIGIHPTNDGKVIRLVFPELTEEKRIETTKNVKKASEAAKVAIRNIRRDGLDALKKQKKDNVITEDDYKELEKGMQNLVDAFIKKIDAETEKKNKEVMSV